MVEEAEVLDQESELEDGERVVVHSWLELVGEDVSWMEELADTGDGHWVETDDHSLEVAGEGDDHWLELEVTWEELENTGEDHEAELEVDPTVPVGAWAVEVGAAPYMVEVLGSAVGSTSGGTKVVVYVTSPSTT